MWSIQVIGFRECYVMCEIKRRDMAVRNGEKKEETEGMRKEIQEKEGRRKRKGWVRGMTIGRSYKRTGKGMPKKGGRR
jgi:hypothetical protein